MHLQQNAIQQAVLQALEQEIKNEADALISDAKDKLEKRIREEVARVSVKILEHVSFERMGTDLIIRVNIFTNK